MVDQIVPITNNKSSKSQNTVAPRVELAAKSDQSKPDSLQDAKKAKEEKKVEGVASIEEIKGAVDDLNDRLAKQEVAVSFTVDDKTNRVVVQITDSDSGKMIRQIPSEETLKFARNVEKGVGLLVDSKL
jgi:flagellar protein FlaG